jgi:hypothetical protein
MAPAGLRGDCSILRETTTLFHRLYLRHVQRFLPEKRVQWVAVRVDDMERFGSSNNVVEYEAQCW